MVGREADKDLPEERYIEALLGQCVVGEPDPDFDAGGRALVTVKDDVRVEVPLEEALVVSSRLAGQKPDLREHPDSEAADPELRHRPVLDIDVPMRLIPSTTPGHGHLYIDVDLTWREYGDLLRALARAGILEEGYVRASLDRGSTFVRLPWVKKRTKEESDAANQ